MSYIKMKDSPENDELYQIFLSIKESSLLSVSKKKQLIRPLFIGEEWSWVVTGISKESVNVLKNNNYKKPPYALCRHHFKPFNETVIELLNLEKPTFNGWSEIISKGEIVHIITNEEHKKKEDYEYFDVPTDEGLFLNRNVGFRYNDSEKGFVKSIGNKSKAIMQKFDVS